MVGRSDVQIEISADSSGLQTSLIKSKKAITSLGDNVSSTGNLVNKRFSDMGRAVKSFESSAGRNFGRVKRDVLELVTAGKSAQEALRIRARIEGLNTEQASASIARYEARVNELKASLLQLGYTTDQVKAMMMGMGSSVVATTGSMNHSVATFAAQFQDIGVTAVMGMSPMMIALQQGTQIAYQLQAQGQGARGALVSLAGAFGSLFSPVSLLSIGLAGLTAVLVQNTDWAKLCSRSFDFLEKNVQGVAKAVAILGIAFAAIKYRAIISGIVGIAKGFKFLSTSLRSAAGGMALITGILAVRKSLFLGSLAAITAGTLYLTGALDDLLDKFNNINILPESWEESIVESTQAAKSALDSLFEDDPYVTFIEQRKKARERDQRLTIAHIEALHKIRLLNLKDIRARGEEEIRYAKEKANALLAVQADAIHEAKILLAASDISSDVSKELREQIEESMFSITEIEQGLAHSINIANATVTKGLNERAAALSKFGDEFVKTAERIQQSIEQQALVASGIDDEIQSIQKLNEINKERHANLDTLRESYQKLGDAVSPGLREKFEETTSSINSFYDFQEQRARQAQESIKTTFGKLSYGVSQGVQEFVKKGSDIIQMSARFTTNVFEEGTRQLASFLTGGKNAFATFTQFVINEIARMAAAWAAKAFLINIAGPLLGIPFLGGASSIQAPARLLKGIYADGGVFSAGKVQRFASGGLVTRPTLFNMGLMGEAGPEAIMPLKRLPGGKLGVQGHATPVNVNVQIINNSSASLKSSQIVKARNRDYIVEVVLDDLDRRGPIYRSVKGATVNV